MLKKVEIVEKAKKNSKLTNVVQIKARNGIGTSLKNILVGNSALHHSER